jgi:hypothetical protein
MIKISLTDFVDIAAKSGTPKATKVAEVKRRPDYEPRFDFYKQIREEIIQTHRANRKSDSLRLFPSRVTDRKKSASYQKIVDGYLKWLGKKETVWSDPPKRLYRSGGVEVIVNPELSLSFRGESYLTKLYFKDDPLDRFRVEVILSLMEHTLKGHSPPNVVMSVMDARRGKLFIWRANSKSRMALVDAEIAYIASIWPHI